MTRAHVLPRLSARSLAVATSLVVALTLVSGTSAPADEPSPLGPLTGRIIDEDGKPIAGIEFELSCKSGKTSGTTTTDGRVTSNAPCDRGNVYLRDPQRRYTTFDIDQDAEVLPGQWSSVHRRPLPGTTDFGDVQMRLPVRITGRVVDAAGKPVQGYVQLFAAGSRSHIDGTGTDAQGHFDFGQQFTNRYQVRAEGRDLGDQETVSRFTPFEVAPGEHADVGDLRVVVDDFPQGVIGPVGDEFRALPVTQARERSGLTKQFQLSSDSNRVEVGTYKVRHDEHGYGVDMPWIGTGSYRGTPTFSVQAGRTTTVVPPFTKERHGFSVKDANGDSVSGLFASVYRADDPNEVMVTSWVRYQNEFAGIKGVDYEVVLSDPYNRYPTVRQRASNVLRVGTPRNDVGPQPEPDLSGPDLPGRVVIDTPGLEKYTESAVVVQAFRADDPSRPVKAWLSGEDSDYLPAGDYKIRLWDPTGRRATSYLGGATSFATARTYTPYLGYLRYLGTGTTKPNFVPVVSPRVTGTRKAGLTLRGDAGVWNGSPNRYSYQWYSGGKPVSGQTSTTYKLRTSDVGRWVRLRVTARTSSGATKVAFSRPVTSTR